VQYNYRIRRLRLSRLLLEQAARHPSARIIRTFDLQVKATLRRISIGLVVLGAVGLSVGVASRASQKRIRAAQAHYYSTVVVPAETIFQQQYLQYRQRSSAPENPKTPQAIVPAPLDGGAMDRRLTMYGYDNSYAKVALWKDCGDSVALGCLMLLIYFAAANRAIEIKDKMSNQSSEPTPASGTSPAGQEPRLP